MPGGEQLGFPLGSQTDALDGRRARRARDRLRWRPEAQAARDRTADIGLVHPREVRAREPEWQLHPRADLVLVQEGVRHPGDVRAGEQLAPWGPVVGRVEDPGHAALDA